MTSVQLLHWVQMNVSGGLHKVAMAMEYARCDPRIYDLAVEYLRKDEAGAVALMRAEHGEHGRADEHKVPLDPDCPCRATDKRYDCARIGCGFCQAAVARELTKEGRTDLR